VEHEHGRVVPGHLALLAALESDGEGLLVHVRALHDAVDLVRGDRDEVDGGGLDGGDAEEERARHHGGVQNQHCVLLDAVRVPTLCTTLPRTRIEIPSRFRPPGEPRVKQVSFWRWTL